MRPCGAGVPGGGGCTRCRGRTRCGRSGSAYQRGAALHGPADGGRFALGVRLVDGAQPVSRRIDRPVGQDFAGVRIARSASPQAAPSPVLGALYHAGPQGVSLDVSADGQKQYVPGVGHEAAGEDAAGAASVSLDQNVSMSHVKRSSVPFLFRAYPSPARRADQGAGAGPECLRCPANSFRICACRRRSSSVCSRQYSSPCSGLRPAVV